MAYLQAETWEITMSSLHPTANSQCFSAAPVGPSKRSRGSAGIGRDRVLAGRRSRESEEGDRPTMLAFHT